MSNVTVWPLLTSVHHHVTYINLNVKTFVHFLKITNVCNYTVGQTLCEVLCMFTVTQLNETSDNNLHIPSDSAVPVLCCCTKYQQISTAGLLHQMSVLAVSFR